MVEIYNRKNLKIIRRKLRRKSTFCERLLWGKIRNEQLGVKFRRQFSIGNFVADFYSPALKLVIEIDGETHSTTEEQKRDREKEAYFKSLDIVVIRYNNSDIVEGLEDVVCDISEKVAKMKKSEITLDVK
jgi:very-short-patch-repair endonuclease